MNEQIQTIIIGGGQAGLATSYWLKQPARAAPLSRQGHLRMEKSHWLSRPHAGHAAFVFSLVRLPTLDADGFPVQQRGVTNYAGLYFVGMPWLPKQETGLLLGVGEAAEHIATHIAAR